MELSMIADSASQIAWAINRIMEVDVVIIDAKLQRITDTFRYPRQRIEIRKNSIIGRIVESGKPLAIDDKSIFRSCVDCPDSHICNMASFIGVPIIYKGETVGAIGLAIAAKYIKSLFGNLSHTISFLEKMAEMLSGKLQAADDYGKLTIAKKERELLIDTVEVLLVHIDAAGKITYYNKEFADYFVMGGSAIGKPISQVISHPQIEAFLRDHQEIENHLLYYESPKKFFDGVCNIRILEVDGVYSGAVLTFRSIHMVYDLLSKMEVGLVGGRQKNDQHISAKMRKAIAVALDAAKDRKPILIESRSGMRSLQLARMIHNESPDNTGGYFVVDCNENGDDQISAQLFGTKTSMSKIRLANQGTLCIANVNKLSLFLQRKLEQCMASGMLEADGRPVSIHTRYVFTSTENLAKLAKLGIFDEGLYQRMALHQICLPDVGDDLEETSCELENSFNYYAELYGVMDLQLEQDAFDMLCRLHWKGDVRQMHRVCEYLVLHAANGKVTKELVESMPFGMAAQRNQSINSYTEEQIRELIHQGKTRDEIAEILQISRATLYRRLKKYGIQ
ncbi:MAG: sigma 54-interacting transcriptional regulator [Oscillospiraceae bacterium]